MQGVQRDAISFDRRSAGAVPLNVCGLQSDFYVSNAKIPTGNCTAILVSSNYSRARNLPRARAAPDFRLAPMWHLARVQRQRRYLRADWSENVQPIDHARAVQYKLVRILAPQRSQA